MKKYFNLFFTVALALCIFSFAFGFFEMFSFFEIINNRIEGVASGAGAKLLIPRLFLNLEIAIFCALVLIFVGVFRRNKKARDMKIIRTVLAGVVIAFAIVAMFGVNNLAEFASSGVIGNGEYTVISMMSSCARLMFVPIVITGVMLIIKQFVKSPATESEEGTSEN